MSKFKPHEPALRAIGDLFLTESKRNQRLRVLLYSVPIVASAEDSSLFPAEEGSFQSNGSQVPYSHLILQRELTFTASDWGWLNLPLIEGGVNLPEHKLPNKVIQEYGVVVHGDPEAVDTFGRLAKRSAGLLPREFRITPCLFPYHRLLSNAEESKLHQWAEFLCVITPHTYQITHLEECREAYFATTSGDPFLDSFAAIQTLVGNDHDSLIRLYRDNTIRWREMIRSMVADVPYVNPIPATPPIPTASDEAGQKRRMNKVGEETKKKGAPNVDLSLDKMIRDLRKTGRFPRNSDIVRELKARYEDITENVVAASLDRSRKWAENQGNS